MGIGEAVVNMVLNKVRMEGARSVTLEVRPSNFAARALYNKLGFEVLGIKENYYFSPQEHAFIMGKSLSQ
jgi:ribosomal-protein-alanine N-acetyltransferase